jgi:hypothetical protein
MDEVVVFFGADDTYAIFSGKAQRMERAFAVSH